MAPVSQQLGGPEGPQGPTSQRCRPLGHRVNVTSTSQHRDGHRSLPSLQRSLRSLNRESQDRAKTARLTLEFPIVFQAPAQKKGEKSQAFRVSIRRRSLVHPLARGSITASSYTQPQFKMGIFSRRPRDGPDGPINQAPRRHHGNNDGYYSMATRPSFGQWLKYTWLDIVTMICMGAIGLGVCYHPQSHTFTVSSRPRG